MSGNALEGRVGVITGGCGHLGWTLALALVERGARVYAVDLPMGVQIRTENIPAQLLLKPCDLTNTGQLDDLVSDLSHSVARLDFLVHNAAYTGASALSGWAVPFEDQSDEAFDAALTMNLAVPFRLTRRLLPALVASDSASILNIASIYGLVGPDMNLYKGTGMGNPAAYAASKGGLVQLTRYLATTLAPRIRVNCVAPGGIFRDQDRAFVDRYEARTPLGRMGEEADVVGAACWLLSTESSYVTGQVIAVDGGWTAW